MKPMYSDPTIGRLVEMAAYIARSDLTIMLMKADATFFEPTRPLNRTDWLVACLQEMSRAAARGDETARKALIEFTLLVVIQTRPLITRHQELLDGLQESLRADGYELDANVARVARLLPTEPSAAPLPPEITVLENELDNRGYDIALNHYRQAVSNLLGLKHEAANAALRSFLEDLVTRLATDHDGYQPELGPNGQPKANQGGLAIKHLVDTTQTVPADDGGTMLRGLWRMSCTNGSHPGRSNPDEARSRLQLVTATARILLGYFPV